MKPKSPDTYILKSHHAAAILIAFLTLPVMLASAIEGVDFSVRDFGAVGNGTTLETEAIQKTVDAAAKAGGGTVVFPSGTYLSGTIYLRDHVTLELQAGAVLLGSTRLVDYPVNYCSYPSYTDNYCVRALIWADSVKNIAIIGRGTIDGQGAAFLGHEASEEELAALAKGRTDPNRYAPNDIYANRPYIIRVISCEDVLVEGITLRNSPMWMQHYLHCNHLTLRGVRVINHGNRNNDMVDIDCCRNVVVTGCYGDSDDDALTLKSNGPDPTENVTITGCILRSHCNALKMGTESTGGFRNISISNCTILRSEIEKNIHGLPEGLAGIALEAVDGGMMERVTISNINMNGIATPIFMRLGNRARPHRLDAPTPDVGVFRDVNVDNIVATGVENISCSITGIPGHPIEGVSLSNIVIRCRGGIDEDRTDLEVPEVEQKYPESRMFGDLPSYGFYCRHVNGLTFRNVRLGFDTPDTRYALVCDDVENLTLEAFQPMASKSAPAAVLFKNVRNAFIRGCNPPSMDTFIRLMDDCQSIVETANNFASVRVPIASLK